MEINLYKKGDFYETYGEQAYEISRILGLTRTKDKDGNFICGFMCSQAENIDEYKKTIEIVSGYKVNLITE